MNDITPNVEQFQQLAEAPDIGPVVMINLLKFKDHASDGSGTGAEAYLRYTAEALEMVKAHGGKMLWSGRADQILVGDPELDWDVAALVEYPSRKAFMEMVSSPEYLKSHQHREAGLERTSLIACSPQLVEAP